MRFLTLLLAALLITPAVSALDLTLQDGTPYREIRLRSMDDRGISIECDKGFVGVDYLKMTEADRITFGYRKARYEAAVAKAKLDGEASAKLSKARQDERWRATVAAEAKQRDAQAARDAASGNPFTPGTSTATGTGGGSSSASSHQCEATTKKGGRCSRTASPGSPYCWQHQR